VATETLTRVAWIGAVGLATGLILVLALHGQSPEPGLVRFTPAGVMRMLTLEEVVEACVSTGNQPQCFVRGESGWSTAGIPVPAETAQRLENGLRFLHVSAPQRLMAPEEYQGTPVAEFGLDPPQYSIVVRSASGGMFTLHVGATHPQGLAHYARLAGSEVIILLPSFVSEPWAALVP